MNKEMMDIINNLKNGQHVAISGEKGNSYFDGYAEVRDITVHVLQSNGETYDEVETYEIAMTWDEIVSFHGNDE